MLKFHEENSTTGDQSKVLILLHGYGSNAQNLIAHIRGLELNARLIAPNAPFDWEGGSQGYYQWFSLHQISLQVPNFNLKTAYEIKRATNILHEFIEQQLARLKLKPSQLFILGFSQGSMMALHYGLTAKERIGGVIACSGMLVDPALMGEKINNKPPICLVHGTADSMVPFKKFDEARRFLSRENFSMKSLAVKGMDHTFSAESLRFIRKFILELTSPVIYL